MALWFLSTKTSRPTEAQAAPFGALIDRLARDGLSDEAARLDELLRQTAWTTGTEFLGAAGLAMRGMRRTVRRRASAETKQAFRSAARAVRRAWPTMFWF